MTKEVKRISSAFHEAGHVVASIALGRAFDYVTIRDGWIQGPRGIPALTNPHVLFPKPKTNVDLIELNKRNRRVFERNFLIDFAGCEGEHLLYGKNFKRTSVYRKLLKHLERRDFKPTHDYFVFHKIFEDCFDQLYVGYHGELCRIARDILHSRWSWIEKVAIALLNDSDKLTYEQIRKLLDLPERKRRSRVKQQLFFRSRLETYSPGNLGGQKGKHHHISLFLCDQFSGRAKINSNDRNQLNRAKSKPPFRTYRSIGSVQKTQPRGPGSKSQCIPDMQKL